MIRTTANYSSIMDGAVSRYERADPRTATVPDMAYSVKEILTNHTIRSEIPVFNSAYSGDVYTPDIDRMDLVEVQAEADYNKMVVEDLKVKTDELKKARKEKDEKAREEFFDREFAKRSPPTPPVGD